VRLADDAVECLVGVAEGEQVIGLVAGDPRQHSRWARGPEVLVLLQRRAVEQVHRSPRDREPQRLRQLPKPGAVLVSHRLGGPAHRGVGLDLRIGRGECRTGLLAIHPDRLVPVALDRRDLETSQLIDDLVRMRAAAHDITDAVERLGADLRHVVDYRPQGRQIGVDVAHDRNSHGADSAMRPRSGNGPRGIRVTGLSAPRR
jgi:hypothetical protein